MTNTELMVLPQHQVIKHDTTEVMEYEPELYEGEVPYDAEDVESYEDIKSEADALELRYNADKERCEKTINNLNEDNKDILIEINLLHAKLIEHQMNLEDSDDLEDKANAEDLKKTLGDAFSDDDTDHETRDNESDADRIDLEERLSKEQIRKKCKALYKQIARATHPDRCRALDDATKKERRDLFLQAKLLLSKTDLEGLFEIAVKLYGEQIKPVNLMERLLAARQKREEYRQKMDELRGSPEWQLFCVALRYGNEAASTQYRMSLEQTLLGLRQMISSLENPQPDSYTHWV